MGCGSQFVIHSILIDSMFVFVDRGDPMFLMYSLLALMAVFKSYPAYSDIALYLAMLPIWKHTSVCKYMCT